MSVSLTRLSWWNWSNGKEKEAIISNGSSSDTMKLCSKKKKESKLSSKKLKKKCKSREERKKVTVVDKEYDLVLVLSDDGVSEESSYDSDWSIGWMEPHASDFFQSDDDDFDAFAVLVPCYRNDCKPFKMEEIQEKQEPSNQFLNVLTSFPNGFPAAEGNKYMDQWLASLQNY